MPLQHKFRTAEDYRDHLPCRQCEPPTRAEFEMEAIARAQVKARSWTRWRLYCYAMDYFLETELRGNQFFPLEAVWPR